MSAYVPPHLRGRGRGGGGERSGGGGERFGGGAAPGHSRWAAPSGGGGGGRGGAAPPVSNYGNPNSRWAAPSGGGGGGTGGDPRTCGSYGSGGRGAAPRYVSAYDDAAAAHVAARGESHPADDADEKAQYAKLVAFSRHRREVLGHTRPPEDPTASALTASATPWAGTGARKCDHP